nr:hypothetical protein BaRGS_015745 [Batillaria attramentaria]
MRRSLEGQVGERKGCRVSRQFLIDKVREHTPTYTAHQTGTFSHTRLVMGRAAPQRGDNASSASRTTDEQEPAIQNGAQNLESSGISSILEENIACDVIKKFFAQRVIFYYKEDGSLAGSDVATVSSDCCGATGEDFGPAGVDRAVAETESENETGLKIVDVRTVKEPSLPSAPSHLAERDLEEASVSGQDSETGLKIVDVRTVNEPSLPSAPLHVAERNLDEEASVSGQESETGLKIVDVSGQPPLKHLTDLPQDFSQRCWGR